MYLFQKPPALKCLDYVIRGHILLESLVVMGKMCHKVAVLCEILLKCAHGTA